ncbi:hypothetical protein [Algiphilus sp.]|uniref:hypothetical protein n=1 Tax=Algiphilus sp. TaxID=1872431 RepID=UPI003BAC96BD
MKMSDKRQTDLYEAFAEPITRLRIRLMRGDLDSNQQMDQALHDLQHDIWRALHEALNLEGPR